MGELAAPHTKCNITAKIKMRAASNGEGPNSSLLIDETRPLDDANFSNKQRHELVDASYGMVFDFRRRQRVDRIVLY